MNLSKWNFVSVVMLSLISTGIPASMPGSGQQQQKRHVPMSSANQSPNVPPYWEHILREFVYKTISQPPPDNINLYKRLLNAPFYGGPFAMPPNDVASVVLSRGDVYYLPNGHWLLCQEGCIDCEVCVEHTHPSLKWVLRRIKRTPVHGPPRQDLQLTVIPQIDGSYHMKNLWPRSYVYVTTQAEQTAYGNERVASYPGGGTGYENPEDGSAGQHRRSNNFWRFVERGSLAERRVIGEQNNGSDPRQHFESGPRQSHDVTVTTVTEGTTEGVTTFNSGIPPRVKPDRREVNDSTLTGSNENGRNRLKPLIPRLILGTDQLGQRHLVHVVPADAAGNRNLTRSVLSDGLNAAGVGQYQNRTAYQKILKRIYDSLSSNRRSIESFLETPSQIERRQTEDHQLQETRNSLAALRHLHSLHRDYNEGITNGTIAKRWPLVLTWNRQRRKSDDEANSNAIKSNIINLNHTSNNSHDLDWKTRNALINVTFDRVANENTNVSEHFNSHVINSYYYNGNASNGNSKTSDPRITIEESKFEPRMFKIIFTTESTTKSSNKSDVVMNYRRNSVPNRVRLNYNDTRNTST